jgi:hypothetical protein
VCLFSPFCQLLLQKFEKITQKKEKTRGIKKQGTRKDKGKSSKTAQQT